MTVGVSPKGCWRDREEMGSMTEASSVAGGLYSLTFLGWTLSAILIGCVEGTRVAGKADWEVTLLVVL